MSEEGWCVLRCAGRHTLELAESLRRDGFGAWAPAVVHQAKLVPMAPTYVFAGKAHMWTLSDMANDPTHRHPGFSMMHRCDGALATVNDCELDSLRYEELRGVPPQQRRTLLPGEEVRITIGPGTGKRGIVEYAKGKFAMVDFGGAMRVKIAAFLLKPELEKRVA